MKSRNSLEQSSDCSWIQITEQSSPSVDDWVFKAKKRQMIL